MANNTSNIKKDTSRTTRVENSSKDVVLKRGSNSTIKKISEKKSSISKTSIDEVLEKARRTPANKRTTPKEEVKKSNLTKTTVSASKTQERRSASTNSRVNKNKAFYDKEEDLSLTRQQRFNFDSNILEDAKEEQKNKEKEAHTRKRESKNIKLKPKKVTMKKVNFILLVSSLIGLLLSILLFDIYHFSTYNHSKTTEKQLKSQVLNLQKKQRILNIKYGDIIYLGDSITEYYDFNRYYNYPIVKSGISGYKTDDILNNLDSMVFNYNPKKIFLLIGTNDLVKKDPDYIIDNIKKIVEKIKEKKPNAKMYIESVYPVNNTDNEKISHKMVKNRNNEDIKKINEGIKSYCEQENITYIDMYKVLADEEGNLKLEYTIEGLHMSDEAYEVISKELKKYAL